MMKLLLSVGKTKTILRGSILLITSSFLFIKESYAQPGSLDNSFDTDGKVTTNFGNSYDQVYGTAIQADGKVIAVGASWNGTEDDFALARYNYGGSPDNSFDLDGQQTTDFNNGVDQAYAIAIQTDGKIIIVGTTTNGLNLDFAISRYYSDGTLDNSFDLDGKKTIDIDSLNDSGNSIALQSDGKIVIAGYTGNAGGFDFALLRLNTDGSLDSTFDSDGKVTTDFGSSADFGSSVAIQNDGKILVCGETFNGSNADFALARYNSDGSLDNSFDTDGKLMTAIGLVDERASSLALQNDGKIVVAGYSDNTFNNDFALVRYNTDGSLDNTFDADGIVITDFTSGSDNGNALAIQNNGKILVAGRTYNGVDIDFALARYNEDGSLDNSFGTDGKQTTDFGSSADNAGNSMALYADGKIIVAGFTAIGANISFAVARYNGDLIGIESELPDFKVSLYPNPAKNILYVSWNSENLVDYISVIDSKGSLLMESEIKNSEFIKLELNEFTSGTYFIAIKMRAQKIFRKFVIE